MGYPQMEDALTQEVSVGRKTPRKILLQEWPFTPGMRFFKLLQKVIHAVIAEYGSVSQVTFTKDAVDENDQPVMIPVTEEDDAGNEVPVIDKKTGKPVMKVKQVMNIDFIMRLLGSLSGSISDNQELILDCVESSVVAREGAPTRDKLEGMLFGDVVKLFKSTLVLNFSEGSSLGAALGDFMKGVSTEQPPSSAPQPASPTLATTPSPSSPAPAASTPAPAPAPTAPSPAPTMPPTATGPSVPPAS